MAEVDNRSSVEITGDPNLEVARAQATGSSSTFTSRFANIISYNVFDETDDDDSTSTESAGVITVTCTDGDWLNFIVRGY